MEPQYKHLSLLSENTQTYMLRKGLLLLLLLFMASPVLAKAQPDTLDVIVLQQVKEKTAPYKTAFSYRYALGDGQESAVSLKQFVKHNTALEAQMASLCEKNTYQGALWYVLQPNFHPGPLMTYVGVGAGAMVKLNSQESETSGLRTSFAGLGSVGVEYKPKTIPMSFSVDYKRTFIEEGSAVLFDHVKKTNNYGAALRFILR
jgi:hypothetical protein